MKAPTVETYQQYVLFRKHSRSAVIEARVSRALLRRGLPRASELHAEESKSHMRAARRHWRQVEMMEV